MVLEMNEDALHKIACRNSEPLFLSPPWMGGGHTSEKANGTITYVTYKDQLYGITCAHVFNQQFASTPAKWLTVHGEIRTVYQFGFFTDKGYQSSFRSLQEKYSQAPDIAIVKLDAVFKDIHMMNKNKESINLDTWLEPDWKELKSPIAFGYPTEHKTEKDNFLEAPLMGVTAELTRTISPLEASFLMASSLEDDSNYYFSGMSGGPVYCFFSDQPPSLIGIVFEGAPGGSAEWVSRSDESFFSKKDIQIRAHTLTPSIFQNWLDMAGF